MSVENNKLSQTVNVTEATLQTCYLHWSRQAQTLAVALRLLTLVVSCSVVSDSLQPRGLQHARPPCPSPSPSPNAQWFTEVSDSMLVGRQLELS